MTTVEFFYDYSSPWTYLAFQQIEDLCRETGAELVWKPILVGGVFNTVNPSVYQNRENPVPPKAAYYRKDMLDWAHKLGIKIGRPPVFPVNSVKAMRGALVAIDENCVSPYSRAVFEAYWSDLQDISQDDILSGVVTAAGMDPAMFFERIGSPEIKGKLRENTDDLIARGGFGSPTMFVNGDDMYFGNDRLVLVRDAIERSKA
jgi:2-hydroxychromene-2-carboxylate isomerase